MAAKKTKKVRKEGDPLPDVLSKGRVLRALKGTMDEDSFTVLYDEAAGQRGGGLKAPPASWFAPFKTFQKNQDFAKFCESTGLDSARAKAAIGRLTVWFIENPEK